jgi:hypothetical protein
MKKYLFTILILATTLTNIIEVADIQQSPIDLMIDFNTFII